MKPDVLFRYVDVVYAAPFDETGHGTGTVKVELREYPIVRRTPKGVWISGADTCTGERFVLTKARRRFACPTVTEARASFIARKKAQIRILNAQLRRAQKALDALTALTKDIS